MLEWWGKCSDDLMMIKEGFLMVYLFISLRLASLVTYILLLLFSEISVLYLIIIILGRIINYYYVSHSLLHTLHTCGRISTVDSPPPLGRRLAGQQAYQVYGYFGSGNWFWVWQDWQPNLKMGINAMTFLTLHEPYYHPTTPKKPVQKKKKKKINLKSI